MIMPTMTMTQGRMTSACAWFHFPFRVQTSHKQWLESLNRGVANICPWFGPTSEVMSRRECLGESSGASRPLRSLRTTRSAAGSQGAFIKIWQSGHGAEGSFQTSRSCNTNKTPQPSYFHKGEGLNFWRGVFDANVCLAEKNTIGILPNFLW